MKDRYDSRARSRSFEENDPVCTRLPHESQLQRATVRECKAQVVELTLSDGRQFRRHKDELRHRSEMHQQEIQADDPKPLHQTPAESVRIPGQLPSRYQQ